MKRAIAGVVAIAIVLLSLWFFRSKSQDHRAQAQREAAYQAELDRFQHDLRLGMPRSEVTTYLVARKVAYNENSWDLDVRIGREPSNTIFCDHFDVYVELGFTHLKAQAGPSPFDNLDSVSVRKFGTCL
jgi:hypothetical protein